MRVINLSCAVLYGQIQASADQDHRLIPLVRRLTKRLPEAVSCPTRLVAFTV